MADAYCFSGGPIPSRGLVLGRGTARLRVGRFGGPRVRKLRCTFICIVILLLPLFWIFGAA